jgi:hypothetical protein
LERIYKLLEVNDPEDCISLIKDLQASGVTPARRAKRTQASDAGLNETVNDDYESAVQVPLIASQRSSNFLTRRTAQTGATTTPMAAGGLSNLNSSNFQQNTQQTWEEKLLKGLESMHAPPVKEFNGEDKDYNVQTFLTSFLVRYDPDLVVGERRVLLFRNLLRGHAAARKLA